MVQLLPVQDNRCWLLLEFRFSRPRDPCGVVLTCSGLEFEEVGNDRNAPNSQRKIGHSKGFKGIIFF
jgi:hypothetical protein